MGRRFTAFGRPGAYGKTWLALAALPFLAGSFWQSDPTDGYAEFTKKDVSDSVTRLAQRLASGDSALQYEPKQGYLKSLLKALRISETSQILVFSKTSFQASYISPSRPRALYFNEDTYVGWIPGAPNIEIISMDPESGPVFFTLTNSPHPKPSPGRQTLKCFQCHDLPITGNVPGLMSRSVFAGPDGTPKLAAGTFVTTARSPLQERWGGWYVTGRHGSQRHMGNEVARGDDSAPTIDVEKGANVTDLARYFNVRDYVSPHSDIVALMVVEKQMEVQNLITKVAKEARRAQEYAKTISGLNFDPTYVEDQKRQRIEHAAEPLVKALLGREDAAIKEKITGTSGFARVYAKSAPADAKGRRLSELDLTTRLLRYSCSPMVYSRSFQGLPAEAKAAVYKGMLAELENDGERKLPLSQETLEILRATVEDFPK